MSSLELEVKTTTRPDIVRVRLKGAGAIPLLDEINGASGKARAEFVEKAREHFGIEDGQKLARHLDEEVANALEEVAPAARADERARNLGLLPFQVAEAYRRAVRQVHRGQLTVSDAVRYLAAVDGADEAAALSLFPNAGDDLNEAYREGAQDPGPLTSPAAAGAGALFEWDGRVIPLSWEVSQKRSADTGTLRTPVFSDRLSVENSSRRRSSAKKLASAHGLGEADEVVEAVERVLQELCELDSDCRAEIEGSDREESQADRLVALIIDRGVELFHTPGGLDAECFATVHVDSHGEVWPISSSGFKRWASREYFNAYGSVPGDTAIGSALAVLEGIATFDGEEHEVFVRRGFANESLYWDLADETGEVIEITAEGFDTIDPLTRGVHFLRLPGQLPLPRPTDGGSIDDLRVIVNVADGHDWTFVRGFLFGALHPDGPYLGLSPNGEQNSGKTWFTKTLRRTIDPSDRDVRRPITNEPDLAIAAKSSLILAVDNLSQLSPNISDAYCSLATGAALSKRRLYSDWEETSAYFKRPVILNGINNVATRADLADRVVSIRLPSITNRMSERRLEQRFQEVWPGVLGALCRAVSAALRNREEVDLDASERMIDILEWVTAAESELDMDAGEFHAAYALKRAEAASEALEANPVGEFVVHLMEGKDEWVGECKSLLTLAKGTDSKPPAGWPKNPHGVGHALRRAAPLLRSEGIDVLEPGPNARPRNYTIRHVDRPDDPDDSAPETSAKSGPDDPEKQGRDVSDISDVSGAALAPLAASVPPDSAPQPPAPGTCPPGSSEPSGGSQPSSGVGSGSDDTHHDGEPESRPENVGIVGTSVNGVLDPSEGDSEPTFRPEGSSRLSADDDEPGEVLRI